MVYTPPANNAVDFALVAYTPPANSAVDFEFTVTGPATVSPDSATHGHTADASVFTTSPAVPTGLNVVSKTSTSVTVGWDAVTGVDAYDIDRDLAVIATDVTATQYQDTGLDPVTEYSYRVRSVVYS